MVSLDSVELLGGQSAKFFEFNCQTVTQRALVTQFTLEQLFCLVESFFRAFLGFGDKFTEHAFDGGFS